MGKHTGIAGSLGDAAIMGSLKLGQLAELVAAVGHLPIVLVVGGREYVVDAVNLECLAGRVMFVALRSAEVAR